MDLVSSVRLVHHTAEGSFQCGSGRQGAVHKYWHGRCCPLFAAGREGEPEGDRAHSRGAQLDAHRDTDRLSPCRTLRVTRSSYEVDPSGSASNDAPFNIQLIHDSSTAGGLGWHTNSGQSFIAIMSSFASKPRVSSPSLQPKTWMLK